jgi:hypothetical protein
MHIWVDFDGDPTDDQVDNVLTNAVVQVEEPIYDNDTELEGRAVIRLSGWIDA